MKKSSTLFGKIEFWEKRYTENPKPFDWYQDYDGVKDIITQFIKKDSRILNVGCGNSLMSEIMYSEGYTYIYNIDFSKKCIEYMQDLYKDFQEDFKFFLMDVRDMLFEKESFDCVIDKGTLDTVLSGEYSGINSKKMLDNVNRVLSPKGIYICISYGIPEYRLPYLEKEIYDWNVSTYKIYKPRVDNNTFIIDEKDLNNYHFIYICKKGIADPNAAIRRMSQMNNSRESPTKLVYK